MKTTRSASMKTAASLSVLSALLLLTGLYIYQASQTKRGQVVPMAITANSASDSLMAALSASTPIENKQVRQVAERFLCSCGGCDEPELAKCGCPTAQEQKKYIRSQLDRGFSVEDVYRLVLSKYGIEKPNKR